MTYSGVFIPTEITFKAVTTVCETWSSTLREDRRLTVLRIFGPKRINVTGEWRKLQNEELNDLYSSLTIVRVIKSRRMRLAGMLLGWGGERRVQGFGGETERK
jgi:hypothetical protein